MDLKKGKLMVTATIVATVAYLIWRIFFTLPIGYGWVSLTLGIILLVAELTGLFEQIVHFSSMAGKQIPEKPKKLKEEYPTVDVFIATYNEPVKLLYKTVNGCVNMDYPDKSKINIYLCDDGGRSEVRELAEKFNIKYLAREDHKGAKAGNLNHALANSKGELIVTLDADMIPMSDFLMASVPYFMSVKEEEQKIGFVQMPQNFYNLDLFQYNLYSEESIPNEQDYFYKDIEICKNKSNSVIYGGSNTVLSRAALEEIGGFVTDVITEDFATGMLIQSKGYLCIATDEVHASGLSPEDLKNLVSQRRRWARGCIQTGRKLRLLHQKGLSFQQKVNYASSIYYWYSPIKRFIYMMSPILFSVCNLVILDSTPIQILLFWLPMYYLNAKTLKLLSGNIRTIRWTNIYETIMFPLLLGDVLLEMFGISEKHFTVTKKGGSGEKNTRHLKMAIPHIILAGLTLFGIVKCMHIIFITEDISVLFLEFWLINNFYNLVMAILFMSGRQVFRKYERFKIKADASIKFDKFNYEAKTIDISEGGFSVGLNRPEYMPTEEEAKVVLHTEKYEACFYAKIANVDGRNGSYKYSFQLTRIKEEEYKKLLLILHDRVPPMTREIKADYGFFEDLRINVVKRRKKEEYYSRKLPRIKLRKKAMTVSGDVVEILSFNYEYVAVKHQKNLLNRNELYIPVDEALTVGLVRIKEIGYYKITPEEALTMEVSLYRIINIEEVTQYENITDHMVQFMKESKVALKEEEQAEKEKHVVVEYNEMELL